MNESSRGEGTRTVSIVFGALLIGAGVLFLVAQALNIHFGQFMWPFFVIVPGAALFVFALLMGGPAGEALTIVGSVITMTGLLLFFQNLTGLWASWAYAWALVAPTSIGLGQVAWGAVKGQPDKIRTGLRVAGVGLAIFLVGAVVFELIIGVNGFGLGRFGWPLLLIGLGVIWLIAVLLPRRPRTQKE